MQEKQTKRMSKPIIVLSIVCTLAIIASVCFYLLYTTNPSESAKQRAIVDKVGRAITLPSETPTIITVADKSKLTNKQLAEKVENGDVLLVFAQTKRLIVYRPSVDKVANMLSFENTADVAPQSQTPTEKK